MKILFQAKLNLIYGFYERFSINPTIILEKSDLGEKSAQVVRFRQIGGGFGVGPL